VSVRRGSDCIKCVEKERRQLSRLIPPVTKHLRHHRPERSASRRWRSVAVVNPTMEAYNSLAMMHDWFVDHEVLRCLCHVTGKSWGHIWISHMSWWLWKRVRWQTSDYSYCYAQYFERGYARYSCWAWRLNLTPSLTVECGLMDSPRPLPDRGVDESMLVRDTQRDGQCRQRGNIMPRSSIKTSWLCGSSVEAFGRQDVWATDVYGWRRFPERGSFIYTSLFTNMVAHKKKIQTYKQKAV